MKKITDGVILLGAGGVPFFLGGLFADGDEIFNLDEDASFQLQRTGRRCVYSSLELSCLQYFSWFPQLR